MSSASNTVSAMTPRQGTRVLVTGASGKIGKYVVTELVARGYEIRALTTRPIETVDHFQPDVDWVRFDWQESLEFDELVRGCSAVIHLGAELRQIEKMHRSNVEATQALARAAESAGVKFFCYISSVAVYGSSLSTEVSEDSPVLTDERDVKSEYLAEDALRSYGRTKLAGERRIRTEARNVDYVILRPTVVVSEADFSELTSWSFIKRAIAGYRHSQQIYVLDVVHAILWFMERSLDRNPPQPGISVYNLADNSIAENTYANFFRKAYGRSSDSRFKVIELPWAVDALRDVLKFKMLTHRRPLARMRFSTGRLHAAGYQHRYGISKLHDLFLESLLKK